MTAQPDAFAVARHHHQAGELRRAEEAYRGILRTDPRSAATWFALGELCEQDGRLAEAEASFRQAAELAPREAAAHFSLGNARLQLNRYAEAENAYRRCLAIQPRHVEALVNLGFVLGELGRPEVAKACYQEALVIRPEQAETHHNLANLLRDEGKVDEALAGYHEALRLKPDYGKAHTNLGVALAARGDVALALVSLREGVRLQPDFAEAHNSLGAALCAQGALDEAGAAYETALRLKPDYPDAHWNRALLRLLKGDYEQGLPAYEWRWRCARQTRLPHFAQPRWDGAPLQGRTILLYAEQGLGDTLQFIRYAPLVRAAGGRVVVQCQDVLVPLLGRTPGIDALLGYSGKRPDFDVYAPLMSVPGLLGTTLASVPANVPYLFGDADLAAHWRRQLAPVPGLRVGIVWQGSTQHPWDRHRSVPLAFFEPLARVPGIQLISLQRGEGAEQLKALGGRFPVLGLGDLLDRGADPFLVSAAVMANLDLLVTVDTASAHLAGGLGISTWVALHYVPDWRWLLGRDDSPWYPTHRLFRQSAQGEWTGVFQKIADALALLAARRARARTVLVEMTPGEVLDRLAMLETMAEHIHDAAELADVRGRRDALAASRQALGNAPELDALDAELRALHEALWQADTAIRQCEQALDFGPRFVALAQSIRQSNDRRAALVRGEGRGARG